MIISAGLGERLREERERTGLNQTDFGVRAGVSRGTQKAYEQGTSSPDVRYLAALQNIDVDVHYVLTGMRSASTTEGLSRVEEKLVDNYRSLREEDQNAIRRLSDSLAESVELYRVKGR